MGSSVQQEKVWKGQLRAPESVIEWAKERAHRNLRSLNAELVNMVREAMLLEKNKQ
jgi:hypothetical protein